MMTNKLGIYVHIPFCKSKCSYCDFLSFEYGQETIKTYMEALLDEIDLYKDLGQDTYVDTIYLGGGTPSYIDVLYIEMLVEKLGQVFHIERDGELTIEINPQSQARSKVKAYKDLGINRLSIGAQSFVQKELEALDRIHSPQDIRDLVNEARDLGFENISLDLIMAIPYQDLASLKYSLDQALDLGVGHLSVYDLILEEGTSLYDQVIKTRNLKLPDDQTSLQMFDLVREVLGQGGLYQYEISNYAREGFESRHNLKYWTSQDYLALGLGASGKLGSYRYTNTRDLGSYIRSCQEGTKPIGFEETLTSKDLLNELIFMGLRRSAGIKISYIDREFGIDFHKIYKKEIEKNVNLGLVNLADGYFKLTDQGRLLSNQVELDFYRL